MQTVALQHEQNIMQPQYVAYTLANQADRVAGRQAYLIASIAKGNRQNLIFALKCLYRPLHSLVPYLCDGQQGCACCAVL